jgi:uncharacterized membrane protein
VKSKIRAITYGGILSAVILLATYIIKFPIPGGYGYINFGDGAIFAAAVVLGPFAAICAALGSALADLLAGFPHYMLPTLLIKGPDGPFCRICLYPQARYEMARAAAFVCSL